MRMSLVESAQYLCTLFFVSWQLDILADSNAGFINGHEFARFDIPNHVFADAAKVRCLLCFSWWLVPHAALACGLLSGGWSDSTRADPSSAVILDKRGSCTTTGQLPGDTCITVSITMLALVCVRAFVSVTTCRMSLVVVLLPLLLVLESCVDVAIAGIHSGKYHY